VADSVPFAWTFGSVHPEVVAGACVAGAAYLGAWVPRAQRGEPIPLGPLLSFFAGLAALTLVLNGPLHDLSDRYLASAHMVQHLVLTLAVPPLLLAGIPGWMADRVVGWLLDGRLTRPVARVFLRPLPQFAVWTVALVFWHLPGPYQAALVQHRWHVVEHLTLLGAAVLGWWPILSPSARAPALPHAAQLLYLFVFGIPMTVVGAMVTGAEDVLYPFYATVPRAFALSALADQRLGGVLMWVPAGVIPVVVFTVVFFRWVAAEADVDDPV
jgi:putative membrane protein